VLINKIDRLLAERIGDVSPPGRVIAACVAFVNPLTLDVLVAAAHRAVLVRGVHAPVGTTTAKKAEELIKTNVKRTTDSLLVAEVPLSNHAGRVTEGL
jgi:hypothetical protein